MANPASDFEQLHQMLRTAGSKAALEWLTVRLRQQQRPHELFEALKMQARSNLGLPLLYSDSGDELDIQTRTKLEDGLLDACREVGMLLLRSGSIRQGWMYMRPVGDRAAVAAELAKIEPTDDNLEELIEVCLHEGVDPQRGYGLLLERHGTCNAITTYESSVMRQSKTAQQAAAGLLVENVHRDLMASVRSDIARQTGTEPSESTLRELVADRDWLFGQYSYHLDTTHLAATVRIARILDNERQLRLALDLTEYGRRLHSQFQYKGEPPFEDVYESHALFLGALVGERVEEAVQFFQDKAQTLDPRTHGGGPVEVLVQLLERIGRPEPAMAVLLKFVEQQPQSAPQAFPVLLELAQDSGKFDPLLAFCRDRNDLLGYATASLLQASDSSRPPQS